MKTFVIGVVAVAAVSVSLSKSAHAQIPQTQYSGAQYFGQFMPDSSPANGIAQTKNLRGLQYCLSMRGKVVGNGGCTDLVTMHLAHSEAVPANFGDEKNIIWGAVTNGAVPGDVIQFEDCYFKWTNGNSWGDFDFPHHSAVIASINGSMVELIHQNAPIGGPVVVTKLDLKWKQRGTVRIWRPVGN